MSCAPKKLAKVVQFYSGCMYPDAKFIGAKIFGGPLLYSDFSIKLDYLGQHGELGGIHRQVLRGNAFVGAAKGGELWTLFHVGIGACAA